MTEKMTERVKRALRILEEIEIIQFFEGHTAAYEKAMKAAEEELKKLEEEMTGEEARTYLLERR